MRVSFELAENVIVYGDVHAIDGYLEVENVELQIFSKTGWDHWAVPRDQTEIDILKDELFAVYRAEKESA